MVPYSIPLHVMYSSKFIVDIIILYHHDSYYTMSLTICADDLIRHSRIYIMY